MQRIVCLALIGFAACFGGVACADVKLPAIFSDHMVLQRGLPVVVWGWADMGEKIFVRVGTSEKSIVAGMDGTWRVVLDPVDAREPVEMRVMGDNSLVIHDVLVGEVWLCSGQSNMAFKLKTAANGAEAIQAADRPSLRLFWVDRAFNAKTQADVVGAWKICTPEVAAEFSAVGYFFAAELSKKVSGPIGLIEADWGGTRAEAWIPRATFDAMKLPYEPGWSETWLKPMKVDPASTEPARTRPYQAPAVIYNGMISPLVGLAMRGVVWYQGETNTAYPVDYERVLGALITSWRSAWPAAAIDSASAKPQAGGGLPFLVVQLPNFSGPTRDWVSLRASQAHVARDLPNVGMVVTMDVGNPHNIHPTNKEPVGKRLAAVAEKMVYGLDVVAAGPSFKSLKVSGGEVVISFDHADGGLVSKGGAVEGFEIAGADGKFVAAAGRIDGATVVLSAEGVSAPVAARYGWANDIKCSLYNGADFPAAPFSSQ